MNLILRIHNLLHRFEDLIFKQAQLRSKQQGTTELFFDNADNQAQFNAIIQNLNKAPGKVLTSYWSHQQKPVSFKLSINAEPGKGARWVLSVSPPSLSAAVANGLNAEYSKLMHQTMPERMRLADKNAKDGAGTGILEIGSLEFS